MMWIALIVAVVLVAVTVAAVLGRVDGSLAEPTRALSYIPLPIDRLTVDDLQALRLDTGLRGYRMEQVDEVIDRLAGEIAALREELAGVRAAQPAPDATAAAPDATAAAPEALPTAAAPELPTAAAPEAWAETRPAADPDLDSPFTRPAHSGAMPDSTTPDPEPRPPMEHPGDPARA